jgi:hypothetical protein
MAAEPELARAELEAALAQREAGLSREDAWRLAQIERAALASVDEDDAVGQELALEQVRQRWYRDRREEEEKAQLRAKLTQKVLARVKELEREKGVRDRERGRQLYGLAGVGGIGFDSRPSSRQEAPPTVGDRLQAGEKVSVEQTTEYVAERLHEVAATIAHAPT